MGTIEVITINGKPIQELIDALEKGIRQIVKDANKYRHPIDDAILY
jgi:hypothetical protein